MNKEMLMMQMQFTTNSCLKMISSLKYQLEDISQIKDKKMLSKDLKFLEHSYIPLQKNIRNILQKKMFNNQTLNEDELNEIIRTDEFITKMLDLAKQLKNEIDK